MASIPENFVHHQVDELYNHFEKVIEDEDVRWDNVEKDVFYDEGCEDPANYSGPNPIGKIPLYLESDEESLAVFLKTTDENSVFEDREKVENRMKKAYDNLPFYKDEFQVSAILYGNQGDVVETLNTEDIAYIR